MRRSVVVPMFIVVFCSAASWGQGQATVTSGWANTAGVSGYTYGVPFVPQIVTPGISFSTYSPNPVGATNATAGNVAGATNATVDNGIGSTGSVMTVPVWYGPGAPDVDSQRGFAPMPMHHMHEAHGMHEQARYFDVGARLYHYPSVAQLATSAKADAKKASRKYENSDVERQNQNNGVVKYRGKTENIG